MGQDSEKRAGWPSGKGLKRLLPHMREEQSLMEVFGKVPWEILFLRTSIFSV